MTRQSMIERPPLLTWGIILMAAKCAFFLFGLGIAMLAVFFGLGLGALESQGEDILAILAVGTFVELIIFLFVLVQIFGLIACRGAWRLSRFWLVTLMVLSGISILDANLIGICIATLVIIGGVQAIERDRPQQSTESDESVVSTT